MKKLLNKSVLVGIASALTALGNPSAAHAVTTITSGAECTNYYASDAAKIDAAPWFIYAKQGVWVTCPILRTDQAATSVSTYVNVYRDSSTTQALTCTLYSHEWNGTQKGASSGSFSGNGLSSIYPSLPASASTPWSHLSFLCYLPPKSMIYNYSVAR